MKKIHCVVCNKYRKFRNPKLSYIFKKNYCLLLFAVGNKDQKKFKEEESIEILKISGLIKNI